MHTMQFQAGYTLIELFIVIAIMGLSAAIAIPAYNDYRIRTRVAELVSLGASAKTGVVEYRITKGAMPTNNTVAGVNSIKTAYVNSVTVSAKGVITVVGNQKALGTGGAISIVFTPTFINGSVIWTCTSKGTIQYAPASCR